MNATMNKFFFVIIIIKKGGGGPEKARNVLYNVSLLSFEPGPALGPRARPGPMQTFSA
jgi:hypothetical protein